MQEIFQKAIQLTIGNVFKVAAYVAEVLVAWCFVYLWTEKSQATKAVKVEVLDLLPYVSAAIAVLGVNFIINLIRAPYVLEKEEKERLKKENSSLKKCNKKLKEENEGQKEQVSNLISMNTNKDTEIVTVNLNLATYKAEVLYEKQTQNSNSELVEKTSADALLVFDLQRSSPRPKFLHENEKSRNVKQVFALFENEQEGQKPMQPSDTLLCLAIFENKVENYEFDVQEIPKGTIETSVLPLVIFEHGCIFQINTAKYGQYSISFSM